MTYSPTETDLGSQKNMNEKLPLQEHGIELGIGRFGDVDLVRFGGFELARKRIRVWCKATGVFAQRQS